MGEKRVQLISLDWLTNQFVFGNAASWMVLIIDEIETKVLDRNLYQRIKMISNGAAIPAMKKYSDFETIKPKFVTHQTMNALYFFPPDVLTEPISNRFVLFKYTKRHPPNTEFQIELKKQAPNLLDYLLTADLPKIEEISPIPLTGFMNIFDFNDLDIVMNYWEVETGRIELFIGSRLSFSAGTYITVNVAVEQIYKICRENGFRIDKLYFRKRLLPIFVQEKGGSIIELYDPVTQMRIQAIRNIQIAGAKGHFKIDTFGEAKKSEDFYLGGGSK